MMVSVEAAWSPVEPLRNDDTLLDVIYQLGPELSPALSYLQERKWFTDGSWRLFLAHVSAGRVTVAVFPFWDRSLSIAVRTLLLLFSWAGIVGEAVRGKRVALSLP
jgi:hypothetical protein